MEEIRGYYSNVLDPTKSGAVVNDQPVQKRGYKSGPKEKERKSSIDYGHYGEKQPKRKSSF